MLVGFVSTNLWPDVVLDFKLIETSEVPYYVPQDYVISVSQDILDPLGESHSVGEAQLTLGDVGRID